jgi:hypothetical protein
LLSDVNGEPPSLLAQCPSQSARCRKGQGKFDVKYALGLTPICGRFTSCSPALGLHSDAEPYRGPRLGAIFVGKDCRIEIHRNNFTTHPPDSIKNPPDPKLAEQWEGDGWIAKGHFENWFDYIRSRAKPNADVEIGRHTATVCQRLVITRQLGRRRKWDPHKEIYPGDEEANALLDRSRRAGWELPKLA